MKTIEKIKTEINDVEQKINAVADEIKGKKNLIEDLKQQNAKLIEQHFGKERQPASLQTQRKRIFTEDTKIQELVYVKSNLKDKLDELKKELHLVRLDNRSIQIRAAIENYSEQVKTANNQIKKLTETLSILESKAHPLQVLADLIRDVRSVGKEIRAYGIDVDAIRSEYSFNLVSAFDSELIENINVSGQTAFNMFDAAVNNRRGYSVARKPVKETKTQQLHPLHYQRRVELKENVFPKVPHYKQKIWKPEEQMQ